MSAITEYTAQCFADVQRAQLIRELRRRLAQRHAGGNFWRVNARAWIRQIIRQLREGA